MRSFVILCALSIGSIHASDVTVVLQFDGERSEKTVGAMQNEIRNIFRQTGVRFEFRSRDNAGDSAPELVVLRFKGECRMNLFPAFFDERGPFAETYVADGTVLPFGQVNCDRVRQSIRPAMQDEELAQGEAVYGRALGRVVAHEIYHMLAKTRGHATTGVNQTSLSGAQLISKRLDLTTTDLERFYNP